MLTIKLVFVIWKSIVSVKLMLQNVRLQLNAKHSSQFSIYQLAKSEIYHFIDKDDETYSIKSFEKAGFRSDIPN